MLQTTVLHTGTEVREALAKALNSVQASNTATQRETATKVTDELNRMRNTLRDTSRESINTAKSELGREVHSLLTEVRADLRSLAEVVREHDPELVDTPDEAPAPLRLAVPHQRTAADAEAVVQPDDDVADEGAVVGTGSDPAPGASVEPDGDEPFSAAVREAVQPLRNTVADLCRRVERSEQATETVGAQLTELSAGVAALRAQLQSALPLHPEGGTSEDSPAGTEARKEHHRLLRRAAQVSHAQLVCHRDTWEFLAGQAGRHAHFRMPAQLTDHGESRVTAALSGRSLIAVLISLNETRHTTPDSDDADRAMADTAYERIGGALTSLGVEGKTVTITLDDRIPAEDGCGSEAPFIEATAEGGGIRSSKYTASS